MRRPLNSSFLMILQLCALFFLCPFLELHGQPFDYPTANLSARWTNSAALQHVVSYPDGSAVRSILLHSGTAGYGPSFAAGFFCSAPGCDAFLFAVFIVYTNSGAGITNTNIAPPQVIWSANRDRPIRENATLQLTEDGNLLLRDADGTPVWSTNTSGQSVVGINLTETGNLMLVDQSNSSVWASFDHPTDSWVMGQTLKEGQRLTANFSATNSTQGQLYVSVVSDGINAFVDSNPPQLYYQSRASVAKAQNRSTYITYTNGSLGIFTVSTDPSSPDATISLPLALSVQYIRLESSGRLRIYEWQTNGWKLLDDVFQFYLGDCSYPTICGSYGLCSDGQCSCPQGSNATYFRQVDVRQPNLGCSPVSSLSCQSTQDHQFLPLNNVSYFNMDYSVPFLSESSEETCKQACLKNCSCKASVFQYGWNASSGYCYLPSQLFSLRNNQPVVSHYNSSVFIKVQVTPPPPSPSGSLDSPTAGKKSVSVGVVLGSTFGALFAALLVVSFIIMFLRFKKVEEIEEDHFDQMPGMPTRFSFEELKLATKNFYQMLGQGGFGSVFEGILNDGVRVAVKRLDGVGQGKKEFLAEVETIGSIHHINLVRLLGFCIEKSHRLLVYEYMPNGSLDKWIFYKNQGPALDWQMRRKIITDIAKGLSYLHEECRQRIAHLDVKPQNILLDDKFNAKLSDFGLSKLIDRDLSHVMTGMRGTPGYLAPEWLTSKITEKVDVYSFGVVVVEIVCGRKNLDYSQPEEYIHLISTLQEVAEANRFLDIVDSHCNVQLHGNEIIEIIKLAMWCLQGDNTKRPSMSVVVKVLEGSLNVEPNFDYKFHNTSSLAKHDANGSPSPSAALLSGPR